MAADSEVGVRLSVRGRREAAKALRDTAEDVGRIDRKLDGIDGSARKAERGMERAARAGRRFAKIAAFGVGGLAAVGATAGRKVFNLGVELEAMGNKAQTVFGDQLGGVEKWARASAHGMGLTTTEATSLAANFADLLVPMGFARDQAAKMSTDVVGLSGALSQWSGGTVDAAGASDVLAKAMLGERDGLKALGISISSADVMARLAAKGQAKLTGAALEQAEAIATQELIFAKSADAQEAFRRGTNKLGIAQAQMGAKLRELRDRGIRAVIPWMTDMAGKVTKLVEEFENGTGAGGRLRDRFEDMAAQGRKLWDEFRTGTGTGGEIRDALATAGGAALVLGEVMRDVILPAVAWFNDHPNALQGLVLGMAAYKAHAVVAAAATASIAGANFLGIGGKGAAAAGAAAGGGAGLASRAKGAAKAAGRVAGPLGIGMGLEWARDKADVPWHDIFGLTDAEKGMVSKINPFDNDRPTPRVSATPRIEPSTVLPPVLVGSGGGGSRPANEIHLYIDGREVLTAVEERAFAREARR